MSERMRVDRLKYLETHHWRDPYVVECSREISACWQDIEILMTENKRLFEKLETIRHYVETIESGRPKS